MDTIKKPVALQTLLTIFFSLAMLTIHAQNIGIGTTTPLSKLHIFGGASGNTAPYSPLVVESNQNTYINLLSPNANETSILFGNTSNAAHGGIIYNNSSTLSGFQFRTNGNATRMVLSNAGNLGIGNTAPVTKLDITGGNNWDLATGEGDVRIGNGTYRLKFGIALGGGGAGGAGIMQYGAVGGYNVLALGAQGKNILRLNGITGRAGIGTDNPGGDLEVQSNTNTPQVLVRQTNAGDYSRVRLTNSSGNNYWDIAGYHGASATDDRLNFFNGRNSLQFGLNGNAAFLLSGNAGSSGQVLQSNGADAAPSWSSTTNTLYNNTIAVVDQSAITLNTAAGFVLLPGMSYTFTASSNVKVLLSYSVPARTVGCAFCSYTTTFIDIVVNGSLQNRSEWQIENDRQLTLSASKIMAFGTGTYTIQLNGRGIGPDVVFGGCCIFDKMMNIQIIPQ